MIKRTNQYTQIIESPTLSLIADAELESWFAFKNCVHCGAAGQKRSADLSSAFLKLV